MFSALLSSATFENSLRRSILGTRPGLRFPGLPVSQLRNLYTRMKTHDASVAESLLRALQVRTEELRSFAEVPTTGPAVVVANHPYGLLDGAVLLCILLKVRSDVRLLVNRLLRCVPGMEEHCIFID